MTEDGRWRWSTGPCPGHTLSSGGTHDCWEPRATLSPPLGNLSPGELFQACRPLGFLAGFFLSAYFTRKVAPITENNLPFLLCKDMYWMPMRNLAPHWTVKNRDAWITSLCPTTSKPLIVGGRGRWMNALLRKTDTWVSNSIVCTLNGNRVWGPKGPQGNNECKLERNHGGPRRTGQPEEGEGPVQLIPPLVSLFKPFPAPHS